MENDIDDKDIPVVEGKGTHREKTPEDLLTERSFKYLEPWWVANEVKLEILPWSHINHLEIPPTRWRIQRLIPMEGFVMIAAGAGSKKTWIALEMALNIARGVNFLGHEEFTTKQAKVLYIEPEMMMSELQRRGKQLGMRDDDPIQFIKMGMDLNNDPDNHLEKLIKLVVKDDIKVIFIDTLREIAGGMKEERADEVRAFFNKFKPIRDKGVVIVYLEHTRKPARFESKVPAKEYTFGSIDKIASVDVLLMLQTSEDSDEVQVHQKKCRLSKERVPFKILVRDESDSNGDLRTVLSFGGDIEAEDSQKLKARNMILEILFRDKGRTRREILEIIHEAIQVGERNTSDALRDLLDQNKITVRKQGKQNYYELPMPEDPETTLNEQENMF